MDVCIDCGGTVLQLARSYGYRCEKCGNEYGAGELASMRECIRLRTQLAAEIEKREKAEKEPKVCSCGYLTGRDRGMCSKCGASFGNISYSDCERIDRLKDDRDSWRRVCERLEMEKVTAEQALQKSEAEKVELAEALKQARMCLDCERDDNKPADCECSLDGSCAYSRAKAKAIIDQR